MKTKLSLDSFKSKLSKDERQRNLDKIVGGIMGQCHVCYVDTFTIYSGGQVYTVVYKDCYNK